MVRESKLIGREAQKARTIADQALAVGDGPREQALLEEKQKRPEPSRTKLSPLAMVRESKLCWGYNEMKKFVAFIVLAFFLTGISGAVVKTVSAQSPMGREATEHPNIVRAIDALQAAIAALQAASDDFGGHKAKAIEASERAMMQLKLALAYRSHQDKFR
jgi:hypothetical protein